MVSHTQLVTLALLQFAPQKGDIKRTLTRLTAAFDQIATLSPFPNVITLPETALSGYFLEGGVRDAAVRAPEFAEMLNRAWNDSAASGQMIDIVAGFYELHDNLYYNSAIYATLGGPSAQVRHVHRKVFLPTYGLFDEERFVEHGLDIRAFDTPWGRAAILICEDAWHSIAATVAAADGAQIIFIPSASPARGAWPATQDLDPPGDEPSEKELRDVPLPPSPASLRRWDRIARDRAEEHGVFVAVTHLVGNEGGKGFAGGSIVADPVGVIRTRGPLWQDAILPITIDLQDITRARADTPLLSDLRALLPHVVRSLQRTIVDTNETPDGE